jgi:hypothetical protein
MKLAQYGGLAAWRGVVSLLALAACQTTQAAVRAWFWGGSNGVHSPDDCPARSSRY